MPESLEKIVLEKKEIEDHLRAIYGEASEELEKQWEDNSIALKDKLDNYGSVITDINQTITLLKDKKKVAVEKISRAIDHLENEIKKMKARLFTAANELEQEHLRGYNYSFHPFVSQTKQEVDLTKVEKEYRRYTLPKLNHYEYTMLLNALIHTTETSEENELSIRSQELNDMFVNKVKIDAVELPKNHPAIIYKLENSVRIT